MSSFKRRVTTTPLPGSRPSPYNSLPLLSTGLSSLDDLLGGGLPLSSSLLIQSDALTSYADLLLKFWVAQGLEAKQEVVVIGSALDGEGPQGLVESLMEVDGGQVLGDEEDEEENSEAKEEKLKIAFRYEGMKQHATTVSAPTPPKGTENDVYCSLFDLTTTKQLRAADRARLTVVDVDELSEDPSRPPAEVYEELYKRLESIITEKGYLLPEDGTKPRKALRIAISSFGSPSWGPAAWSGLYSFLHRLRPLLRRSACTLVSTFPLPLHASSPTLLTRLSHASDGVISLTSFASSPLSISQFPRHHGLLSIPKLPSLGSLVPPSAKLSVLRGLGGGGEGRENNLGFRVKRRRFVVETVNADEPVGPEVEKKKVEKKVEEKKVEQKVQEKMGERETKVRFAGEKEAPKEQPRRSVSSIMHKQPELYEF
ncbi:Elongator complex protein 4 [Leucosporidium creatinivorum]|uniref:Elongator complex protein 4 n=1 Tax=Leucosporidium creatinivorum TaxID=106004 RepID=A0A1Y2F4P0_9BASI|nr:Elongator complex protein 4 [Leucosporidium creatinivorum]